MDDALDQQLEDARRKRLQIDAERNYLLEKYGDTIAKKMGWTHTHRMEAIHLYLIHRFRWLPRDVRSMSLEDIEFVLSEEMLGAIPEDAFPVA